VWHIREYGDQDYGLHPDPGWPNYTARIANSDHVITVSEALASHLRSYADIPDLSVIYNGVVAVDEVEAIASRCRTGMISQTAPSFMILGGVMPSKGQDVAVRAVMRLREEIPDARLAIVGDGEIEWIQQVIEDEQAQDAVELWGYVDDPWSAYAEADALLMCSRAEGMGRVTAEAMLAGVPIIGRDAGGTGELIQHGETGRLYDETAEDLAGEMRWVLDHPEQTQTLVDGAQVHARATFTNEEYARRVRRVWANVTE
jgi:glycosyltransferase involved in cell wall biosynthesis